MREGRETKGGLPATWNFDEEQIWKKKKNEKKHRHGRVIKEKQKEKETKEETKL